MEHLLRRVPRASIAHTTKGKKQPRKTLRRKIFCPPRSPIDESSRKPKNATAHAAINRTLLQHEKSYAYYRLSTGSYAHYRHPTGSKQNRIAVCAPTKCPRATDNNTNRFNGVRLLTRACAWHNVHTPAHQVSKNRPRNKSSQTTIFFYIRVDIHAYSCLVGLAARGIQSASAKRRVCYSI